MIGDPARGAMAGGSYALLFHLAVERQVAVGSLGSLRLPPGVLVYAGSARTGLAKRVERHREKGKPVVAHVDALAEAFGVAADVTFPGLLACALSDKLALLPGAVPVIGFGSTSCGCITHLYALPGSEPEDVAGLVRAVG